MSTPVTVASLMAINAQALPLPDYLVGRTEKSASDFRIRIALKVFEHGRLSLGPCRSCVENGVACIVASTRSNRCLRCSCQGRKSQYCLAEGVKVTTERPRTAGPGSQSGEATNSASALPGRPSAATQKSQAATKLPDAQVACQSVFAVEAKSTNHNVINPQSNTDNRAPTEQKQKRSVPDPVDPIETGAKRLCDFAYATATEHPYAPTAPNSTGRFPILTDPTVTGARIMTTLEATNVRYAPFRSIEYDLAIRTQNRVAWARWAYELHKEIRNLRQVQDVGPYTMGVIAMMKEDGVWPMDSSLDPDTA